MPATLRLTDDLADALADAVRRGVPIETAAQAAGITDRTFYEWRKAAESGFWSHGDPVSPESLRAITRFARLLQVAEAEAEVDHITAIAEAGATVGKSGVPEWRARAWLLNNHPRYRQRYRQHRETIVEQSGTVLHEHKLVKELPKDDLQQAYLALDQPTPDRSENA